jgi:hypothetical protein
MGAATSQGLVKKKNKPYYYCYRGSRKGHVMSDCTTIILCYDNCDADNHATKACALLKETKPTAMLH